MEKTKQDLRTLNKLAWETGKRGIFYLVTFFFFAVVIHVLYILETPKNLDSNIKKNTAFIKKCKTSLGTDLKTQLLNDINKLSLEKYISEIVGSVLEGMLKCKTSVDIAACVEVKKKNPPFLTRH